MRGVTCGFIRLVSVVYISTHTPHARRDVLNVCYILIIPLFQLTRLMRGVTYNAHCKRIKERFQLTRLMRGVTRVECCVLVTAHNFNSHASCEA